MSLLDNRSSSSSRPTSPWATALITAGALVVVGIGGKALYSGLVTFVKQDPLAAMRTADTSEIPLNVGIQMKGVSLRHYEGKDLTTQCNLDRIDVQQNRQIYDLVGVKNGRYATKKGVFKFEAESGNWNGFSQTLTCSKAVKVSGKDLDLTSTNIIFDQRKQQMDITSDVQGKAFGGKIWLANLSYGFESESLASSHAKWSGKLPGEFVQDTPGVSGRTWDIDIKNNKLKGDLMEGTDGTFTDGEIIVRAPKKMSYDRKKEILTASGGVLYFSGKANILADQVVVYRKEKRAVLTGNVQMLVKPKKEQDLPPKQEEIPPFIPNVPDDILAKRPLPENDLKQKAEQVRDSKTLREYPLAVNSQKIEYWYRKGQRRAEITGMPQARQELPEGQWRYAWTERAAYDGEKELLKMFSGAKMRSRMKNSVGDDLNADWFEFSTKENDDEYSAENLKGKFADTSDEDERPDGKKKDPPKGGQGGGQSGGGLQGPIGTNRPVRMLKG